LSGSGLAVKGRHIIDPRTGRPEVRRNRTWALAKSAAESDALSTAAMILTESELVEALNANEGWLVFLNAENQWRQLGQGPLPPRA
jgi:thiamine biosynthesis lipoprotein